ncbi:DUF3089 domain-containing protein [Rhodococcus opacus]|uniref:DUF3089 domain-containing protein n=1 Tax=Rhodococcus opacus (strain B4) TaxID=632772 RepID=C1B2H9_RHOOB|nr:DUF3089 domain-containing protein [Rhodococcus opacus]BAH50603.1 hypothetical protein ROP_23560 [Rhodococcus opacus B4]
MFVFIRRGIASSLGAIVLAAAGGLSAPAVAQPAPPPVQWLCTPEMASDPCDLGSDTTDLGTGVVSAADQVDESDKPVDCFYVYPTVSDQLALNADLTPQPEVQSIASYQAARFSSQCRVFAPIYRQMTLTPGIEAALVGAPLAQTAYGDVLGAWNEYLAHENNGRGVILIGHSQGTMMLRKLIRDQIDPNPELRKKLVGAFLMGGNVTTARGSTVGGDFQNIPVCTEQGESGCVVAYSTAVADPTVSLFGNSSFDALSPVMGLPSGPGYQIACTDPAVLSGNTDPVGLTIPSSPFAFGIISVLLGYTSFPHGAPTSASSWTTIAERTVGGCTDTNGYRFYQFHLTDPTGQPVNELPLFNTHLVDVNLGYDRLISIAEQQTENWQASA